MNLLSRTGWLFLLMALSLGVGGCWDNREIEDTAFIMLLGLDRHSDGDVVLSGQVAVPERMGQNMQATAASSPPFYVATARGPTLQRAFVEQGRQHSRRGLRAHSTGFVVGEELAREGLQPFTDFVLRDREIRLTAGMYVADGQARTLLSVVPTQNPQAWEYIQGLADQAAARGHTPSMRVHDMTLAFTRLGEDLILPRLAVVPVDIEPVELLAELSVSNGEPPDAAKPGFTLEAAGAAVFREDRMVGWLSPDQVLGVLWVRGLGLGNTVLSVKVDDEHGQYHVSLQAVDRAARVRPQFDRSGQLQRILVEVTVDANVTEVMGVVPAFTSSWLRQLSRPLAEKVKGQIEESIEVSKLYGADVFAFGEEVRRVMAHRQWEDLGPRWRDVFVQTPIDVRVEANIRRTGTMIQTLPGH